MANLGGEWVVKGLVVVDIPKVGKGCAIEEAMCNLNTKNMVLDPIDDDRRDRHLDELRCQLNKKLDELKKGGGGK